MLFNEPKLLKFALAPCVLFIDERFSALQRAEIAEMDVAWTVTREALRFSALQRAEIAEIWRWSALRCMRGCFSALQRAEIAEIGSGPSDQPGER